MKGIKNSLVAGLLVGTICLTQCSVFASDEPQKNIFETMGDWFCDRGTDIQNTAFIVGDWTCNTVTAVSDWTCDTAFAIGDWTCNTATAVGNWTCDTAFAVSDWTCDRVTDVQNTTLYVVDLTGDAISTIDLSKLTTPEYYQDSTEKILLGSYSDKDPTALSIGVNLAASLANVDIGLDIRDLVYDIQHLQNDEVTLVALAIDAAALIPIIGVVKHVDTISDGLKLMESVSDITDVVKEADTVADAIDDGHDMIIVFNTIDEIKNLDTALDTVDSTNDTVKACLSATNVADGISDTTKAISKIQITDLPEQAQNMYKKYESFDWDGAEAIKDMNDGTVATKIFHNYENRLPISNENGTKLFYREYDAFPFGTEPGYENTRGVCRFVRDNFGKIYFTDNHYTSFQIIADSL